MKKTITTIAACALLLTLSGCGDDSLQLVNPYVAGPTTDEEPGPEPTVSEDRKMTASINGMAAATAANFRVYNNKILVSWRFLPTDNDSTAFDLYRTAAGGEEVKLNSEPISDATCYQDGTADKTVDNTYRLTYADKTETIATYTMSATRATGGLPYVSIPMQSTTSLGTTANYRPNDASIGDVDGDGENEIILKRVVDTSTVDEDEEESGGVVMGVRNICLLEAYKLDGTFLWRMQLGPNLLNRPTCFAVYDFDGDGRAEIALRTSEGVVFGDGTEIGDTNGDGKTDYRVSGKSFIPDFPEFLSIVEGSTGKELARTSYIPLGTSEAWGDSWNNRSSRYRIAVAHCQGTNYQVVITRGCYQKIVLQAFNYQAGQLTKIWDFDTTVSGNEDYKGQGHHSLSVADVDGDGYDEIVYGAMTVDHNGKGLYSKGWGHGDALHVGKFDTSRDGLQVYACFESKAADAMGAACWQGKDGESVWEHPSSGDVGRALVADIDPNSPGCEFWWAGGNAMGWDGTTLTDLSYQPSSCNMAIWFTGSLNRQLYDRKTINAQKNDSGGSGRAFTIYEYGVTDNNGTKSNPCIYCDLWGDWREEIIMPTSDGTEIRIFTTWYPTNYRFPYLLNDHTYMLSVLNQNIGYNQPTQLGWYLGSDLAK